MSAAGICSTRCGSTRPERDLGGLHRWHQNHGHSDAVGRLYGRMGLTAWLLMLIDQDSIHSAGVDLDLLPETPDWHGFGVEQQPTACQELAV